MEAPKHLTTMGLRCDGEYDAGVVGGPGSSINPDEQYDRNAAENLQSGTEGHERACRDRLRIRSGRRARNDGACDRGMAQPGEHVSNGSREAVGQLHKLVT